MSGLPGRTFAACDCSVMGSMVGGLDGSVPAGCVRSAGEQELGGALQGRRRGAGRADGGECRAGSAGQRWAAHAARATAASPAGLSSRAPAAL